MASDCFSKAGSFISGSHFLLCAGCILSYRLDLCLHNAIGCLN